MSTEQFISIMAERKKFARERAYRSVAFRVAKAPASWLAGFLLLNAIAVLAGVNFICAWGRL